MTPQELKASILQLAIQGKLVEQRPEEGTGGELLWDILTQRRRGAECAEKKLTRRRGDRGEKADAAASFGPGCPVCPSSPVPPADAPFDIPESWVWVRLGEMVDILDSMRRPITKADRKAGPYPYYGASCIQDYVADYIFDEPLVLLGEDGAKWGRGDNSAYRISGKTWVNNHAHVLRPLGGVEHDYLVHALCISDLTSFVTGTTVPKLNQARMCGIPIPLPPFAEQKRIVAKIDELLPYIDRYEKAWSKLEDFNKRFPGDMQKSLLQMAIQGKLVDQRPEEGTGEELYRQIQSEKQRLFKSGKIKKEKPLPEITPDEISFDIPESWVWVRIGNIGSWSSGATPSRTQSEYYGGSVPWLKTGDLTDGYVTNIPETITDLALEKTSLRLNPVGSVLMAMYGATIGKLGILQVEATTNQACCACVPYEGMFNKYLFYFLKANRRTFIKMGEGGAQPNISKEKIISATLPLPPLAEQRRIVAKLEELLPLCERLK